MVLFMEQRSHDTEMHTCVNLLAWWLFKTVLSFEIMNGQWNRVLYKIGRCNYNVYLLKLFLKLTHDGKVKLADVGVGKYEEEITGTICGTSLYLAPEVLDGRIYNSRADMYSFAFVLWELWYGERVFADTVVSRHQSKFLQDVKDGLRPCHIDKTSEPSPLWITVMESCWERSPGKRKTASDALAVLKLLKNKGDAHSRSDSRPPTPPPKKTVPSERRPRSCSQKPPVKPKPKSKSTRASVSYSSKSEDLSLQLDSNDKA